MNNYESHIHKKDIQGKIQKTRIKKKKTILIILGIVALSGGIVLGFLSKPKTQIPQETFVVRRGSIAQEVVVTGRVKPAEEIRLAFEKGGKIKNVNVKVGDIVSPGQALAYVDTSELQAQLLQAEANVSAETAKLEELKRGSRPEEIQIKETELKKAQQDLQNLYGSVLNVENDAYSKADDAVRSKTDSLFINDDLENPELTFLTNDVQVQIDAVSLRKASGNILSLWKKNINEATSSSTELEALLKKSEEYLSSIRIFLLRSVDAVNAAINLPQSTIDTYKTNLGVARANVNSASSAITNQIQLISAQKVVVERIKNELDLTRAGATRETLDAQEARLMQAQANVAMIRAQIAKAVLISPIRGIVTQQDAKVGEIVAPNVPLISVISDKKLEIEANIPEVDIGNVAIGNVVRITLDAFPNEQFTGKVTYIDPAETVKDGVVNFKVTILFDEPNEKIRSGFTANLSIETKRKENVLIVPQLAIVENDSGAFVKKWDGKKVQEVPVMVGVRDKEGNVEIVSGLSQGDTIVNIGLKNGK